MVSTPIVASRCFALVPCAGRGERAGSEGPKQYRHIAGQSVVAHTLAALGAVQRLSATLVVLAGDDREFERHAGGFRCWAERVGGASRAASVANGLVALCERGALDDEWVLVHDAARCLVRPDDVERLIAACEHDAVGGLLALPLADTLKRARASSVGQAAREAGARAEATLDRGGLWQAQTPQMFRIGLLRRALAEAGDSATDEASAIERLGHAPRLVAGSPENFKLTWPADFELAERLLGTRS